MKNWWYYHKWYVVCGLLLCVTCLYLVGNALGWFKKEPDLQIAYVGEATLPDDIVNTIKQTFASFAEDYNQDGEIIVQVNQYASGSLADNSAEAAEYRQAAELRLIADINDCESYFFLLENPEEFQKQYQILATADGTCPNAADFSITNKVFCWDTAQEPVSSLYVGRRCFYDSRKTENAEECAALWNKLKGDD